MRNALLLLMTISLSWISITQADQHEAKPGFKRTTINEHLTLLQGKGGNILVSHGNDGLLIIDNDYADMSVALKAELDQLGGQQQLQYVINTHWHGDHTGGNSALGKSATIVAHDNVRHRLSHRQEIKAFKMISEPAPKHALPSITYADSINLFFNNEKIHLQFFPAHTDSDSVVFLDDSKVVHTGDLMFNGMYPFVDVDNGGNPLEYIKHLKQVEQMIGDDYQVIPGHGTLTDKAGLSLYITMLEGTLSEVRAMKDKGYSLDKSLSTGLSERWTEWNAGFIKEPQWITVLYKAL